MWLLYGCSKPEHAANLVGTYSADYQVATERLTLSSDGTFTQEITLKATSKIDIVTGRWSYDAEKGYIQFDNTFMLVLNGFREFDPNYASPKRGRVITVAKKFLGRITIGTDESGIIYTKD